MWCVCDLQKSKIGQVCGVKPKYCITLYVFVLWELWWAFDNFKLPLNLMGKEEQFSGIQLDWAALENSLMLTTHIFRCNTVEMLFKQRLLSRLSFSIILSWSQFCLTSEDNIILRLVSTPTRLNTFLCVYKPNPILMGPLFRERFLKESLYTGPSLYIVRRLTGFQYTHTLSHKLFSKILTQRTVSNFHQSKWNKLKYPR